MILVVDDDEDLRKAACSMLIATGFEVIVARDGEEAVETYQAHMKEISAVLMDVTMPRLGGVEATLRLREMNPSVKVILSSGYWDHAPVMAAKPNAFLPKPYMIRDLQDIVHRVLHSHHPAQVGA